MIKNADAKNEENLYQLVSSRSLVVQRLNFSLYRLFLWPIADRPPVFMDFLRPLSKTISRTLSKILSTKNSIQQTFMVNVVEITLVFVVLLDHLVFHLLLILPILTVNGIFKFLPTYSSK